MASIYFFIAFEHKTKMQFASFPMDVLWCKTASLAQFVLMEIAGRFHCFFFLDYNLADVTPCTHIHNEYTKWISGEMSSLAELQTKQTSPSMTASTHTLHNQFAVFARSKRPMTQKFYLMANNLLSTNRTGTHFSTVSIIDEAANRQTALDYINIWSSNTYSCILVCRIRQIGSIECSI